MVLVNIHSFQEKSMKVIGSKMYPMVKVNLLLKMAPFSKDNLNTVLNVALGFINGVIILFTMANGKTISFMVKENIIGVMVGVTPVCGE